MLAIVAKNQEPTNMIDRRPPKNPVNEQMFDRQFELLTGFSPLSWQSRLFSEYFERGELPAGVDIPTGLGKTAVMAIWLIARVCGVALPRRLVYVVDRRAVVDQATDFAESLRDHLDRPEAVDMKRALGLSGSLPISTLRGQHADNREWLEDPASTAIIVGTVDMIGSRLLFEGYGISRKMRPYHAGLLGADTLVVLDESHLVPPFEKLLEAIDTDTRQFAARTEGDRKLIPPFKLVSLSATGRTRTGALFRLKGSFDDPKGRRDDLDDEFVERCLRARKVVRLVSMGSEEKLETDLAQKAWKLTDDGKDSLRCIIFCNKRETAEATKREIEALAKGDKKQGQPATDIHPPELFVGARRVRERVEAADALRRLGFIAGSKVPRTKAAFLIATSAGEVGVDLDADHMVCDLVAWERMVQRLGRVNRRGTGSAKVVVALEPESSPTKTAKAAFDKPENKRNEKDRKAIAAHQALVARESAYRKPFEDALALIGDDCCDGSPGAIRALKQRAVDDPRVAEIIKAATTAPPLRPALTRALVDAWSMTSLEEHTGRPEIAPWLRGWVEEEPQTAVVWRSHLPVRTASTTKDTEIEAFFEAAAPHISEVLETESYLVCDWLLDRAKVLVTSSDKQSVDSAAENESNEDIGHPQLPLRKDDIVAIVLSKSGECRGQWQLGQLLDLEDKQRRDVLKRKLFGAVLIVDVRFGGLSNDGLLDSKQMHTAKSADDGAEWMRIRSTVRGSSRPAPVVPFRVLQREIPDSDWKRVHSFVRKRDDEGKPMEWLHVEKWRDAIVTEEGRSASSRPQTLGEHQSWAECRARAITEKLALPQELIDALAIAARLHDEGKRAVRWQRAFRAEADGEIYAKTIGPIDFALLDGYRHEFGSLRYAGEDPVFQKLDPDTQDLVLHLIAAHHGFARPVIATNGCEDAPPSALEERARDVALRFARLQKRWGSWGLAWLESLLRAADQQASRMNDDFNEGSI